jgi:hypothetical protein
MSPGSRPRPGSPRTPASRPAPLPPAAGKGGPRPARPTPGICGTLLAEGRLPECWIPPGHILEYRALLETYHDLRREHTAWVQRIHAVFFHQGAPRLGEDAPRTGQGLARLREAAAAHLSPAGQLQAAAAPDMPAAAEARMHVPRTQLREAARHLTGARVLAERLYGVGPVTGLALTCWLAGEGPVLLLPPGGPVHRAGHHRALPGPQRTPRAAVPAAATSAALGSA